MLRIRVKNAAGFTLVEMTVVMAIVAILSLIGIAVLTNLKNESILDTATQEIVNSIREAQNKAISVANVKDEPVVPVAWGVKVNITESSVTPFWVKPDFSPAPAPATGSVVYLDAQKKTFSSITFTASDSYFAFSAPFGKYYGSTTEPSGWKQKSTRPKDFAPTLATSPIALTLTYRTSSKTITIDSVTGDVYAN